MDRKVMEMLKMQDSMNRKVHPDWRAQHFDWHRAIWLESAELVEHYGWKWWKKQQPDMAQVKLEIIDIWHFGLSMLLQTEAPITNIVQKIVKEYTVNDQQASLIHCVENFVSNTLACKNDFDIEGFSKMASAVNMTFDDLYCGYVGKNVLNFFRQDHGYKDGTYIKSWKGREDNEHLAEIVQSLDHDSATFRDELYQELSSRYAACSPAGISQ